MNHLSGMPVYLCDWMATRKQVRFPRSKKKRMRRKWAKQSKNYRSIPDMNAVQMNGGLYMHPALFAQLKTKLTHPRP